MTGNTEVLLIYGDVVTPPKCTVPAVDIYSQFICTPAVAQQKDMGLQWRPFFQSH